MAPLGGTAGLLEQLYGAATYSVRWESFLCALAEHFQANSAVLIDSNETNGSGLPAASYGVTPEFLTLAQELTPDDILTKRGNGQPVGEPFYCRMLLSDDEVHRSRIYRELLEPAGIEYRLTLGFAQTPHHFRCITVMRPRESAQFTATDLSLASDLALHIDRAISLHAKMSSLVSERAAALSALNSLGMGVVLMDRTSSVRFVNREAQRIFSMDDGLSLTQRGIECCDPVANRLVAANIHRAVDTLPDEEIESCLPPVRVERKSGAPPFALFVISSDAGYDGAFADVLISDPGRSLALAPASLRRLYDITRAESKVFAGLLGGSTVSELTEELAVTTDTVRAHLKHIFKATRTKSQADLIRRVMLDTAWMKTLPDDSDRGQTCRSSLASLPNKQADS